MNLFKKKDKALVKQGAKKTGLPMAQAQSIDGLMQLALKSNAGLEQMEKLIQMKYKHEEREAKKEFFAAMSRFQAEVGPMLKNGNVNYTKKDGTVTDYNYAPLGQIEKQIKEPMANNLLSKSFEINDKEGIEVTCIATHANGHSEKTSMKAAPDVSGGKNTIQSRGSTITYLTRYTLLARFGLVTADEDNDGQGAPKGNTRAPEVRKPRDVKKETAAVLGQAEPIDEIPFEIVDEKPKVDPKLVPGINALNKLFKRVYPDCDKKEYEHLWLELIGPAHKLTEKKIKELGAKYTEELKNIKRERYNEST